MGNVTTMTVFVWTLNILIFLSQVAMLSMNPNSIVFYNRNNTVIEQHSTGGSLTMPNQENIASELNPSSSEGLEERTGIFFIDVFNAVRNWLNDKIEYFTAIVMGPYNILNSMGLPAEFSGSITLLWYAVSILLLVLVIFGRSD